MDEKYLEQYKKIYVQEKISEQDLQKSWENISRILPAQDSPTQNPFSRYGFLFVCIVLLALIGTVGIAQASQAGELLYPVKVLTNNVAAKIFGKPEITAEKVKKDMIEETTQTPDPTEKESKDEQKDLKQKQGEGKEIREQNIPEKNASKEPEIKQEKQVKGVSTDNEKREKLPANEVKEMNNPKSVENGKSNKNESNNGNTNKDKSKNDNYRNAN